MSVCVTLFLLKPPPLQNYTDLQTYSEYTLYLRGADDLYIFIPFKPILSNHPFKESSARAMLLVGPIHISLIALIGKKTST